LANCNKSREIKFETLKIRGTKQGLVKVVGVVEEMKFIGVTAVLACTVLAACSDAPGASSVASTHRTVASRPMPGVRVGLTPMLEGGHAGWCVTMTTTYPARHDGASCGGVRTSTGPIFDETCTEELTPNVVTHVLVLTRGDVAAVTVAGGAAIPTESNNMLPAGLRSAAIELPGYKVALKPPTVVEPWRPCPRVTALDTHAKPIHEQGRQGAPLVIRLPRRQWKAPARPPSGVCRLSSTRLRRRIVAAEGTVALRVRPLPKLIGKASISCAETTYAYMEEHDLPASVLLSAAHPGANPPPLPDMTPVHGHPGVFASPPSTFARRVHGAWLVVQEEDNIGPSVPVELLEHLHATVDL
jgi:hypothetical protein